MNSMNFLGRTFIILIFVMCMFFMAFTILVYSNQQNWKIKHDEVKKQLDAAKSQVADLTKKQTELETSSNAMLAEKSDRINALDEQVQIFGKEKVDSEQKKAEADAKIIQTVAAIKVTHENLGHAQADMLALRENFNKTQQDWNNLLDDYVAKTDEAHDLQMKLSNLEEVGRDLVQQYNSAQTVLKQFGLKPLPEIYSGVPLHRVDGRIVEVRKNGYVEITIGEDSGIMKGHQLDVYRRAEGRDVYIGVAEVVLTEPNRAACKMLPEYRKGNVQVNDIVTSEFSQDRQKYQVKGGEHVATKDH